MSKIYSVEQLERLLECAEEIEIEMNCLATKDSSLEVLRIYIFGEESKSEA